MTAVVMGLVFIFAGIFGILRWSGDLLIVLRGLGPLSILIGGAISLIAGIASLRPPRGNGSKD